LYQSIVIHDGVKTLHHNEQQRFSKKPSLYIIS